MNFKTPPGLEDKDEVQKNGGRVKYAYHLIPAIAAELPIGVVEKLEKNPRVKSIELDGTAEMLDVELDSSWGVKYIGSGLIHDTGNRGTGIKVAVLDSGVDYTHPDLNGTYAGGYDFVNRDADPMDDFGHGTSVSGVIAAEDDNAGVVGVVPAARLYALKVFSSTGGTNWSDIIAALQWCVDNGIQVTNSSFGSYNHPGTAVEAAYNNTYARGIVNIAATGNSGNADGSGDTVFYPARFASVIAVASISSSNTRAPSSGSGPTTELAAPGVYVYTTIRGGGYAYSGGTSIATPHVAGAAALILAAGVSDRNGNGLVNDEVRQALIGTALDIGVAGRDAWYGYGVAQVDKAIAWIRGTATVPTSTKTPIPIQPTVTPTRTPAPIQPTFTPTRTFTPVPVTTATPTVTRTPVATATPITSRIAGVRRISYTPNWTARDMVITGIVGDQYNYAVQYASVVMDVYLNGRWYGRYTTTTTWDGRATIALGKLPNGVYTTVVRSVQKTGYTWNGLTPTNQYVR